MRRSNTVPVRGRCTYLALLSVWSLVLLTTLTSCVFPGLVTTSAQLPVVNRSQVTPTLPPVRFPQDEGSHNYLTEWWYYTGHLEAIDGAGKQRLYGFELVVFQASRSDLPLLFPAHFAITDLTRGEFHYDQRAISRIRSQVPEGIVSRGINLHVGGWSIQGADGHDHLQAEMQDYAINLQLESTKPAVLHNETGLITAGLSGFSYYYSRTHLTVSGILTDHHQPLHVTGLAWMDHQWGNFLAQGNGGWDWYSLHLNDNTELMLYLIHDSAGNVISTYADYDDINGKSTVLQPDAIHTTVLDHWTSPATHITYPSGWRIDLADPHLQTTLTLTPMLKNQELVVRESTNNIYWEGAVHILGQRGGKPLAGQGYIELTGYV